MTHLRSGIVIFLGLGFLAPLLPSTARSQRSADAEPPALTAAQQQRAVAFAEAHHPELAGLLNRLRQNGRAEYRAALRELLQDAERLGRLQERMPERYERELEAWKLDSRIKLLAARLTMSDDPEAEAQLKQLVRERIDVRIAQLKSDRERLQTRLQRVDESINRLERQPETAAAREVERILNVVKGRQRTPKSSPKTSTSPPPNASPKRK